MAVNHQGKIIVFGTIFLLISLLQTFLKFMPFFYEQSLTPSYELTEILGATWLILAFLIWPMFVIIATALNDSKQYRVILFVITVFYSVINFFRLGFYWQGMQNGWYQVALLITLFVIGLMLNVVCFQWIRHCLKTKKWQKKISF
jgi:hypothetical protein